MKPTTKQKQKTPLTLELRDRLKVLIEGELDRLQDLLNGLEGKERLDAILKLMPLVIPKAMPVQYYANEDDNWSS